MYLRKVQSTLNKCKALIDKDIDSKQKVQVTKKVNGGFITLIFFKYLGIIGDAIESVLQEKKPSEKLRR